MSLAHQIGFISGTRVQVRTGNVIWEAPAKTTVSISPVWRRNLRVSFQNQGEKAGWVLPVLRGGMRADLTVACRAVTGEAAAVEREHKMGSRSEKGSKGVPVFVMMPLDSVKMDHTMNRKKAMNVSLQALKSAGVEGIMVDVWWGLVEKDSPREYNWGGYSELLEMAKKHGLKVQAVMSFHQCGGNVGDSCKYVSQFLQSSPNHYILSNMNSNTLHTFISLFIL